MDDVLLTRLDIFASSPEIANGVVDFVRQEFARIEETGIELHDETAGMFTGHLVNALSRAVRGEALESFSAVTVLDAVVKEKPLVYSAARNLAERANLHLVVTLPDTEVRLITLHLATVLARANTT